MSESNEKQMNELETAESVDPKAVREEEQRKAEKRSKVMYTVIAVAFVIVAAIALIWRFTSTADEKDLPAAVIDGQEYTAAEVSFYYQNLYSNFMNDNYFFLSYLGMDMNTSLKEQTISEEAAAMMGIEAGITWHEYILDETLSQMAGVQDLLADAEATGFVYPDSLDVTFDSNMFALETTAASSNLTTEEYLKAIFGSNMTLEVYKEHLMNALKYEVYAGATSDSLTYTAADLQAAYEENRNTYDNAAYEYVLISGTPETKTDADGNTIEATEDEIAAAKEAAKTTADELFAALQAGGDLETLAKNYDNASYVDETAGVYTGTVLTEWAFDTSRNAGDTVSLESGSNRYVAVFHERYRKDTNTVDVRHILLQPVAGTLAEDAEGYEAEHEQLLADCKAQAEALLEQWKSGEATEESFAALANEHSTDGGSNTNGGLYTAVEPGTMVQEFNDWCFDASRKPGDTGIVYGTNGNYEGYHIMYYSADNRPVWELNVENDLRNTDLTEWITAFGADAVIEKLDAGLELVG